jgi:hypothetical protein
MMRGMVSTEERGAPARKSMAGIITVLGLIASVIAILAFLTGKASIGDFLPGEPTEVASPEASHSVKASTQPSEASTQPSSRPKPDEPVSEVQESSEPEVVESEEPDPGAVNWPTDEEIINCLEQRNYQGYSGAQDLGLTDEELGDAVEVTINVDDADVEHTFWQTDSSCEVVSIVVVQPGETTSIESWGGALWHLAPSSEEPDVTVTNPFAHWDDESIYDFGSGSATVRYEFV